MKQTNFLLAAILLFSSLTSFAQVTEKNYRIYSVRSSKEVTLAEIAQDMQKNDVLFFGEEHNDSVAHFLQIRMLETLFKDFGDKTTLSMEMFDRDVQTVMNEYLTGNIREKHFIKDARAWSNYRDYKPMVEFSKTNHLDVVCANAPTRYTNLAGRKGQDALKGLPGLSRNYFAPLPYDTASGPYYEKLQALTSHTPLPAAKDTSAAAKPIPAMAMGDFNLIMAQSLWDATMAFSIAEYLKSHKDYKVMQVNGRFHSDEGFAVVTQLKNYAPKLKVLVISAGPDDSFPDIDWSKHSRNGDYIIITDPSVPKTFSD